MTETEREGGSIDPEWTAHVLDPWVLGREGLRRTCREQGGVFTFGSEPEFDISHRGTIPPEFRRRRGTQSPPRPFVCELHDVTLHGPSPIAVDTADRIVLESCYDSQHMLMCKLEALGEGEPLESVLSRFVPWAPDRYGTDDERHFERLFPLVGYWDNYFHWTLLQLPRVRGLEHYRRVTGADPTVAIRADAPDWLTESLELVGIDTARCHAWQTSYAEADRFVVPSSRYKWADDYYPSRADCRWLRERVLGNVTESDVETELAERVYVSRADAVTRRVDDRAALIDRLASLGFTEYVLSDLTVAEQAALFDNSEMIVGPHGAGLSNMVYASDATVVELLPETVVRPVFYYLANEVGLEYEFLVTEAANDDNDLAVDVERVVSLVERHLR